jgi:hypothetical protein
MNWCWWKHVRKEGATLALVAEWEDPQEEVSVNWFALSRT